MDYFYQPESVKRREKQGDTKGPAHFIDRTPELVKAGIIHVYEKRPASTRILDRSIEASLQEAVGLAEAIDLSVVFSQSIGLSKINPSTYIGSGTLEEIVSRVRQDEIKLIVVDTLLSPVQQRNLEKTLNCKVIDRTGLILEIFAARARTREGRLQVDLAYLMHRRSRLVRAWTHLERQRGGFGFTGGPGESQMELDRRMIEIKIMKLEKELEQVKRTRALHRKKRQRNDTPMVALVGYTNAGKSTLFNTLTDSNVFAKDLLFATLDPTIRPIKLPNGRTVLLSDTVGFISNLPTQLVAAFRATLEEVQESSVIVHVRDCANEDHEVQKQDVMAVLDQLEIDYDTVFTKPSMIDVYNKIDVLPTEQAEAFKTQASREDTIATISAITGDGIDTLLHKIQKALQHEEVHTIERVFPHDKGALLAWCYRQGVMTSRHDEEEGIHVTLIVTVDQEKYIDKHL